MDFNAEASDSQALDFSSYLPYVKTEKESLDAQFQPLDYRSFSSYNETNENESTEPPILDLSCKKTTISPASSELRSTIYGSRSNSPANSDHLVAQQRTVGSFFDSERKSPIESRTFMITPPSETDSPRKNKLDSIYEPAATTMTTPANNSVSPFSILPMNIPLPIVTTVLPTLLGNGDVTKQTGQILGAQLPAASIPSPNLKESTSSIQAEATAAAAAAAAAKKAPRPFKAYPKDPLALAMGSPELIYTQNSNETYSEFRKRMLESVKRSSEGTNTKMRRTTKSPGLPTSTVEEKDAAYWERRKRNNEAAKRSRDARRAKEDEIAIRAAFLEQENMKLKYELVALRNETAKLKCMVYST